MARKALFAALSMMAAISPAFAGQPEPSEGQGAPAAGPDARYCLRVEAITGSRIEPISCDTRQEWSLRGVDVDKEWEKEGVRVIS